MSTRQRWWLGGSAAAALIVVVIVAVAIAGSGDEPVSTTTSPPTTSATTTSTSSTTTASSTTTTSIAAGSVWPLTGVPLEPGTEIPPVLAVKIDNTLSARPQAGLADADLVFDIPVEGGVSRLLAFYQSHEPVEIGPVRSVREVDSKLLAPFEPLIAHSGGVASVTASVRGVAIDVGHPALGSEAYRRDPERPAPYDLMLDPMAARAAQPDAPAGNRSWLVFGAEPPDGQRARTLSIASSLRHQVTYGYSSADGGYLRFHGTDPHLDASDRQVVASNVIVLFVDELSTGRTDSAGAPVPDYEVYGTGDALVFRDGTAVKGRWERGRQSDFFRLFDTAGPEIGLSAGTTWVHLVPVGQVVEWQ